MTTTKLATYFLLFTLTGCGQKSDKSTKHVVNPKAIVLNDSACSLISSFDSVDYLKAILLLNKATAIDSNYYKAYWNKLAFQFQLGRYDEALRTAKHLNRIKPDAPDFYVTVGMLYEKTGDTVLSKKYFNDAIVRYDRILDTLDKKTINYDLLLMNKGVNLILAGQQANGNKILKQLYIKQTDTLYKEMISMYLDKNRKEILENYKQNKYIH